MNRELIVNLIKSHILGDEVLFRKSVSRFARELYESGERELAYYILELIGGENYGKKCGRNEKGIQESDGCERKGR